MWVFWHTDVKISAMTEIWHSKFNGLTNKLCFSTFDEFVTYLYYVHSLYICELNFVLFKKTLCIYHVYVRKNHMQTQSNYMILCQIVLENLG